MLFLGNLLWHKLPHIFQVTNLCHPPICTVDHCVCGSRTPYPDEEDVKYTAHNADTRNFENQPFCGKRTGSWSRNYIFFFRDFRINLYEFFYGYANMRLIDHKPHENRGCLIDKPLRGHRDKPINIGAHWTHVIRPWRRRVLATMTQSSTLCG